MGSKFKQDPSFYFKVRLAFARGEHSFYFIMDWYLNFHFYTDNWSVSVFIVILIYFLCKTSLSAHITHVKLLEL